MPSSRPGAAALRSSGTLRRRPRWASAVPISGQPAARRAPSPSRRPIPPPMIVASSCYQSPVLMHQHRPRLTVTRLEPLRRLTRPPSTPRAGVLRKRSGLPWAVVARHRPLEATPASLLPRLTTVITHNLVTPPTRSVPSRGRWLSGRLPRLPRMLGHSQLIPATPGMPLW